jgi:DDE domain
LFSITTPADFMPRLSAAVYPRQSQLVVYAVWISLSTAGNPVQSQHHLGHRRSHRKHRGRRLWGQSNFKLAERGLSVDHTSIWRWTQTYGPEVYRRLQGEVKRKSSTWHMDESFVRVAGRWIYLFRAVDSGGQTVDLYLSETRDLEAAKIFLTRALDAMHARSGFPILLLCFQSHPDMNAPDHEHVFLELDLAYGFADQASGRRPNMTRLQRASKGSSELARRRGDDVVERGCPRFGNRAGEFIVLRDGAVYAENHRLGFGGKIRLANRPFDSLDSNFRTIHHVAHDFLRSVRFSLEFRRSALAIQTLVFEAPFKRQILRQIALMIVARLVAK